MERSSTTFLNLAHRYRRKESRTHLPEQKARRLYELATKKGNDDAESWLAYFDLMGIAGPVDNERAFKLSKLGVEKKVPFAFNNLGFCYFYGHGVEINKIIGINLWEEGVKLKNAFAEYHLGICYYFGQSVEKNFTKGLELLTSSANQDNIQARSMLQFCSCYLIKNKKYANIHFQKFISLFKIAMDQGFVETQFLIGFCHEKGLLVEQDLKQASYFYELALNLNHVRAQSKKGFIQAIKQQSCSFRVDEIDLRSGSFKEILDACVRRNLQSNRVAQSHLARYFERLYDKTKETVYMRNAIILYKLAACEGEIFAQVALARSYGYAQNFGKSFEFYQLAALNQQDLSHFYQGYGHHSQLQLGKFYLNGIGTRKDPNEARYYYFQAELLTRRGIFLRDLDEWIQICEESDRPWMNEFLIKSNDEISVHYLNDLFIQISIMSVSEVNELLTQMNGMLLKAIYHEIEKSKMEKKHHQILAAIPKSKRKNISSSFQNLILQNKRHKNRACFSLQKDDTELLSV